MDWLLILLVYLCSSQVCTFTELCVQHLVLAIQLVGDLCAISAGQSKVRRTFKTLAGDALKWDTMAHTIPPPPCELASCSH